MCAVIDFSDGDSYDKSLVKGARAAVSDVLGLRKGERILIVTNPNREVRQISMAIYDAALELGSAPVVMFQREKGQFDFAEEEVLRAVSANPDVALSISAGKLGKDSFGLKHGYRGKRKYDHIFDYLYEEKKMRAFWSPGITCDMFSRTVPIDYTQLRTDCRRVRRLLNSSKTVRITAPGGTDLTIGVRGRKARPDDGDFRRPGLAGNIPSGEVFVSPELGTANGMIAFDGSIVIEKGEIMIRDPILADVKDGYVTSLGGGAQVAELEKTVKAGESKARKLVKEGRFSRAKGEIYSRNARSIGELGIGLNREAKIVANMLEDEKVYGTCHFAIGSNYDGDGEALIHLDGLVKRPTIVCRSKSDKETTLMKDGKLDMS